MVSTATRLLTSSLSIASRIASLIWSAILSGWPSVTDSEVNRRRDTYVNSLQRLLATSRSVRAKATLDTFEECWVNPAKRDRRPLGGSLSVPHGDPGERRRGPAR